MGKGGKGMGNAGWFLTGIGLGALGGVLYAPRAGYETRTEFLASAKDAKEKGAALSKQAAAKTGEYVQQCKEVAEQYFEKGKTVASDHLAQASAALEAGKNAYAESSTQSQTTESTFGTGTSPSEPGV